MLVGKLIKIHGKYPPNELSTAFQVDLGFRFSDELKWNSDRGIPEVGLSLLVADFGNSAILGQAVSVIPFARWEKLLGKSWSFKFQYGLGAAWFNRPYDRNENKTNLVIGSTFTAATQLNARVDWQLSQVIGLNTGINFTHYSNSHVAVPNIGANVVSGSLGVRASLAGRQAPVGKVQRPLIAGKWRPGVRIGYGWHEFPGTIEPKDGPTYAVYNASLFASKADQKSAFWQVGLTYTYYPAFRNYIINQQLFSNLDGLSSKASTVILYGSRQWSFGRVNGFAELGVNLHAPFMRALNEVWDLAKTRDLNLLVTGKLGFRYEIFELKNSPSRLYVGLAVKSNGGTADYLESSFVFLY
jgi:hypothetical protein